MRSNVWKSVVGLEIHAQISSASKLFSGAGTQFGRPVNTSVSLFDAAIPGTLPVLNRRCVEAGLLTALALSCQINPVSLFDRKHYFYADLPAGYQITQQRRPLAHTGKLSFQVFPSGIHRKPYTKMSRIQQLQLEQDSGKSLHDEEAHRSLVDLNRAGVSLMELVFEPDLKDGEEAAALVKELALILQRLGTCSCKMEEGALRVDANVSVHREGKPLGTRTEVKNIGSVRAVSLAIQHEIERQTKLLERGEPIVNETRAWDAVNRQTVAMRDKEEKQDYRYMPEPNLPPLRVLLEGQKPAADKSVVDIGTLKQRLPELPEQTRQKLKSDYGLSPESTITLVNENVLLQYFWDIVERGKNRNSRIISNILTMELLTLINKNKMSLEDCPITAGQLGETVDLLQAESINLLTARKVLNQVINGNPNSPTEIMRLNNWALITDRAEIEKLCQDVLEKNPKLVEQFKAGKKKVLSALLGQVAKVTEQRANMACVAQILQDKLGQR